MIQDGPFRDRLTLARSFGISEKRLLGWEPTEIHEHEYDAAGRLVRTVVTRETEWDDVEREKAQALVEYEAEICDCGLHRSIADTDPDMDMTERTCPSCAALARNRRIMVSNDAKAVELLGPKPLPEAARPDDGRHLKLVMSPSPTTD